MESNDTTLSKVEDLLKTVWSALEREIEAFEDDSKYVDMLCVERHAENLCEEMLKLSRHDARKYEPDLKLLHQQITDFSDKMQKRRHDVREQIEKLNQFSNASKAYRSTTSEMAVPTASDEE